MYRDPEEWELALPLFNAIWNEIKSWDINVPDQYHGYCGATGNHVCAIMDAVIEMHENRELARFGANLDSAIENGLLGEKE